MDFSDLKIIVSEVDGIITEGLSGIGEMNQVLFKQFYTKDFEAINELKKDYVFVFMSIDPAISMSLCRQRNIPFYFAEKSKSNLLGNILRKYSMTADNLLYVGSTYSDVKPMITAAFSMCTEDSPSKVKNVSDHVMPYMGGTGVLCYVCDFLAANKGKE